MNENPCTLDRITRMLIQALIETGVPKEQAFKTIMELGAAS